MEWQNNTPKSNWLLGMDIGGTSVKLLAATNPHQIEQCTHIATGQREINQVLEDLVRSIHQWGQFYEGLPDAIGIGFPGIVDGHGRVIGAPNLPHWVGIDLGKVFSDLFKVPVSVANDANAAALAEADYLALHQGYYKVIFLTLGTGVGAGIILDGQILRGAKGFAAEAGHITVEPNGFKCGCGRQGCLEQYFSARGILQVAREEFQVQGELSVKQIFKKAHAGSELEIQILNRCADCLAIGISNLCALFDPDCIVLGGGISKDGEMILDLLEPLLRQRVQYPGYSLPDLRISHYHDHAGGIGCLLLAQQVVQSLVK